MDKTTETTRNVKVTDFLQESPPALLISETVLGTGGRSRQFTQKVQIREIGLWRKITADVVKGDTIRATIKTVWPDTGHYFTCLADFALLETATSSELVTAR